MLHVYYVVSENKGITFSSELVNQQAQLTVVYTCSVLLTNISHLKLCMCVLSCFSHVQPFVTPWTAARQAPQSMGFSRKEYWSGLPCPPAEDLPDSD